MKICLSAEVSSLHELGDNLRSFGTEARRAKEAGADLLLFGEAYLQGFDALSFDYPSDIFRCLGTAAPEIAAIKRLAQELQLAIGFGFYENAEGGIYSSYMVVDKSGQTAGHYRRQSPGWKAPEACADYREGNGFETFVLEGRKFCIMICGDFWEDSLLTALAEEDSRADAFIWPVHTDFSPEKWSSSENEAYRGRTAILAKPVFFINNYVEDEGRAKGGACVWRQGKELAGLPMGKPGRLLFDF